ncbi:hypothetical protein STCU_02883 [Strigomonas culicis]|uniref:Uncharacterized protein n=1 Tax=Strigomonas culicis TaxID=28005 RepID=S9UU06_9TRYP|nr:hypothetical protein STCU_02883 [Strigomonas culicis]|eukprot:EPY32294.1 hypothetical protein STCU_02883 [Strigomonas culicis]
MEIKSQRQLQHAYLRVRNGKNKEPCGSRLDRPLVLRQRKARHHVVHDLVRDDLVSVRAGHRALLPVGGRELGPHEGAVRLLPHDGVLRVALVPAAKPGGRRHAPVVGRHVVGEAEVHDAREEFLVLRRVVLCQLHELLFEQLHAVRLVRAAHQPRLLELVAVDRAPGDRLQVLQAAVKGDPAVHALVAEDNGDLVQLHEVARDGHGPALVATVCAKGVQLVPQQRVIVRAQVDGRHGLARLASVQIFQVLRHCSFLTTTNQRGNEYTKC